MKCEECLSVIEEYFDGELDGLIKEAIRLHLGRCIACATALHELGAEQEAYAGCQPDLGVSPELWAGVRARIVGKELGLAATPSAAWQERLRGILAGPRVSAWVTAGLVLMAIGLTVLVMNSVKKENGRLTVGNRNLPATIAVPERPTATVEASISQEKSIDSLVRTRNNGPAVNLATSATAANKRKPFPVVEMAPRPGTPDQLVHEAEQKYLAAIAMLSRSVGRKRSKLDTVTLMQFDQVLTAIDRTIAGTRKAVRQHPDDPIAVQYMLTAYARKVDVLREMAGY